MNKHLHTKRRHFIILLTLVLGLLAARNSAFAADEIPTSGTYNMSGNVTITKTIKLTGNLTINCNGAARSITRNGNFTMFDTNGKNLTIKGASGKVITINGNSKTGHLIVCGGASAVTLSYVNLQNAKDTSGNSGHALHYSGSGNVSYSNGLIQSCTSQNGPAVSVGGTGTITLTSVEIKNCNATAADGEGCGGTIRSGGTVLANLILDNCNIHNNTSGGMGGGVYWNAGATVASATNKLTIRNNTKIQDNTSTTGGAGIFVESAMEITSATISGNKSGTDGGGINVHAHVQGTVGVKPISISNCTISSNTASGSGGGIYITYPNETITLASTVNVQGNTATNSHGGGVYLASGNLTITGAKINSTNKAENGYGGGIYTVGGTLIVESSAQVSSNKAKYGGGIFANGGTVTVTSSTVSSNTATSNGGGIYANGAVTVTSSTIASNTATSNGGGIFANAAVSVSGTSSSKSTLTGNSATNGGAVYANSGNGVTIGYATIGTSAAPNTVTGAGGGIYAKAAVNVNTGAAIEYNRADSHGGGFYVNDGVITMKAGSVQYNYAGYSGGTAHGGGFYVTGGDTPTSKVDIQGGNIRYNHADNGNGGGIYVNKCSADGTSLTGTTFLNSNNAKNGAGAYINSGKLVINSANCQVNNNTATTSGGGLYVNGGTVTVTSATISVNTAATHGGGMYSAGGTVTLTSATVSNNTATSGNGGGLRAGSSVTVKSCTFSGNKAKDTTNGKGGGIFATGDGTEVSITRTNSSSASSLFTSNTANNGGGVYANSGSVTIGYATIGDESLGNEAAVDGGGIYAKGSVTLNTGAKVRSNTAGQHGGGVYVSNGTFTMNAGSIGGSTAYKNTATDGNGGGVYVTGSSAKVVIGSSGNTATISYNEATNGDGGGVYVDETGSDGTTIQNAAQVNSNKAINGGGVFVNSGTISVETNSTLTSNTATGNGGGIYANGGTVNVSATTTTTEILKGNSAYDGGAIYAYGGTVNFSNGVIINNYASHHGGGLYIPATGKLTLKGTATLTRNHVPDNMHGGGVYLAGVVEVGTSSAKASSDVLTVEDNFAATTDTPGTYTITDDTRNNIYLPQPVAVPVSSSEPHKDVITIFEDGMDLNNTSVGFSVPHNFVPVIYCSSASYLAGLVDSEGILTDSYIFEDSHKYTAYYHSYAPYDPNHIYLSSGTWVNHVTSQPSTGFTVDNGNVIISTNEGLAWLISYVNGLNDVTGGAHDMEGKTVTLTADVDMGDYAWVPIGSMLHADAFKGTFDGNGHIVDNIYCMYLGSETGGSLGMFGVVNGNAVIKNVFLHNAILTTLDQTTGTHYLGGIAENLSGSAKIYNCGVEGSYESLASSSVMGGLVGRMESGEIHSSYAMAKMDGFTMGGLVGQNTAGDLYNSFANPQFTYNGGSGSSALFVGGLVADNGGTVENCYVRFSRTQSLTDAKFGQLAGNNDGSITDCYTPLTYTSDVPSTIVHTGSATSDTYKIVDAPYLYNRPNDNLVGSTGKTLTEKLNTWVSAQGTSSDYAFWKRTTAGGYATSAHAGNINDDYPIHKMKGLTCVGSTDGIFMEYKYSLDEIIRKYNGYAEDDDNVALWLYAASLTAMTASGGTPSYESVSQQNLDHVKLYIDEDATLLQANGNVLKAFTSQTLGDYTTGRGERWHYCSSSLQQSAIGFSYGSDNVSFSWDPNPCSVTFSTANDAAVFPGDLTSSDIAKVDLYAFYEPEYHWINLKRNTNSHWHMNATTVPIVYNGNGTGGNGNETYLVPGKGYLMSIDQEQLLQNWGQLNNGQVTLQDVTYTEANAWAGLLGYNVLGNPYQSYLDFNAFITNSSNAALFASKDAKEITYATYEPRYGAYVQYKSGSSRGSRSGDGLIHAHQGFLIRRGGGSANANAIFTNDMRSVSGTSPFRSEQPAFPLINLTLTDGVGNADIAVVELGRERNEGVEKLRVGDCGARISLALDHEEYAILFRDEVVDYQALHLEAQTEGTYTLTWETANGEFEALTLVDNITGTTTDMLTRDSYTFEANPDQYASRFKIVIGDYKDIEENEGGASTGSATAIFAYYANGEIHLAETYHGASLQIVDVTGRVIVNRDGVHAVSTNGIAPGVYLLRLTDGNGTKVQKMVIE